MRFIRENAAGIGASIGLTLGVGYYGPDILQPLFHQISELIHNPHLREFANAINPYIANSLGPAMTTYAGFGLGMLIHKDNLEEDISRH